jgi:murein lipoprotein
MMKQLMTICVMMTALGLAGCATAPEEPSAKPQAQGGLSKEAMDALAQAEADVKAARKADNSWTTAIDALQAAEEAARKGDSAAVLKHAKKASQQAKLSEAQLKYPPLSF